MTEVKCRRCRKTKSADQFWYRDRDVCTECLVRGQVCNSNKRARGFGQTGELGYDEWLGILRRYGNVCALCGGNRHSHFSLEIDHVVPLSKGGSHDPSNLRPLCNPCNVSRGNGENRQRRGKPLEEFPCTCPRKTEPIEQHYHNCSLRQAYLRRMASTSEAKRAAACGACRPSSRWPPPPPAS